MNRLATIRFLWLTIIKNIAKRWTFSQSSILNPQSSIKLIFPVIFLLFLSTTTNAATSPRYRIITLAPNLAEIVYAAGAGKNLVGVSSWTDYPLSAKRIPIVANYRSCDIEKIISLKPDLVVAWYNNTSYAEIKQLRALNIPVYMARLDQIEDVPRAILEVGKLAGTERRAKAFAQTFNRRYQELKKYYSHRRVVEAFYQLSLRPLMTVNRYSLISKVIQDCGGENIFNQALGMAPQISLESILTINPQVILVSAKQKEFDESKRFWANYSELDAVKNHFVFEVDPDWIERYGPRILDGMDLICRQMDQARKAIRGLRIKDSALKERHPAA